MGRKRLLTILATVAAAVTLQVGPAAAQSLSVPGVGDAGGDDCLEIGADISLSDALKLDPSVCVSENGVEVDGGSSTLKDKVEAEAEKATKPVQETTKKAAETTKQAAETTKKTAEQATGGGGSDGGSSGGDSGSTSGGSSGSSGSSGTSTSSGASGSDVAASGEAPEPLTSTPPASRQAQLGALMAIRNELAAGSPLDRGVAGPVQTFGGLGTTSDLAAPQVADPNDVDSLQDPQVAPATEQEEQAIFASTDPMRDLAEAPLALQLLAAALVLGAAAVWTIAAREYGSQQTTSV
jgi:hypothetical protein